MTETLPPSSVALGMPNLSVSAEELYLSLGELKDLISSCAERCQRAPYPSTERQQKVAQVRRELNNLWSEVEQIWLSFGSNIFEDVRQKESEQKNKQGEIQATTRRLNEINGNRQIAKQQGSLDAHNAFVAQHQQALNQLNSEYAVLNSELNNLREIGREKLSVYRRTNPLPALEAFEPKLRALLDRSGELEREIDESASAELLSTASDDLKSRTTEFKAAEGHHNSQTIFTMIVLLISVCISLVLTSVLFFPSLYGFPSPDPSLSAVAAVLYVSGRIAILLFLVWLIRHFSGLHQMHIGKAIYYRDRCAALEVAQALLSASPDLGQRRALLQMLAAQFIAEPHQSQAIVPSAAPPLSVKEAVEAVRPILEVISKMGPTK